MDKMKYVLVSLLLIFCLPSKAAIIEVGNLVQDTDSGLDWLKLQFTSGRSYEDISGQLGSGGEFEGYRFATTAELNELFINLGGSLSAPMMCCSPSFDNFRSNITKLGNNYTWGGSGPLEYYFYTVGMTSDFLGADSISIGGAFHEVPLGIISNVNPMNSGVSTNNIDPLIGSWLVVGEVPEPSIIALMFTGLIGLGIVRRKAEGNGRG